MRSRRLQIVAVACLIGCTMLGLFALLDRLRLDWRPWMDLFVATGSIFGYLGTVFARDLRRPDCLVLFIVIIALHLGIFVHLLRSGMVIPVWDYLPVVFVEYLIVAYLLRLVGKTGARASGGRPDDRPHE